MSGGTAWADVGFCAIAIGDLELAEDVFQKGLQYSTMFMLLELPRHLAGAALLALARDQLDEAEHLADKGRASAEERRMRHMYHLTALAQGRVRLARGELESSLAYFQQAETEALSLGMLPFVYQARVAMAEALECALRRSEAQEMRDKSQETIQEIAGLFENEDLRSAYLQDKLEKLHS